MERYRRQRRKLPKVEAKANSGFAAFRKKQAKKKPAATDETGKELAAALEVGLRITTKSGKAGTIRYIGAIEPLPKGYWVGVELDEAEGRNDGEVKGVRLFTCEAKHGAVMRPDGVTRAAAEGKDDDEEL